MIDIPVITIDGVTCPSSPIPPDALATVCDGAVYRVAQTPEDVAALLPPPPDPAV
ncbi:hypothetical protein [Magnetospirillum fulvum]|uniref:hypothetical protein n=1 Tax=Magnetospirillum fulvum TaxID=1082 RepID=UPI0004025B1F|nr:hypothetical protein [Magnetospirillum fulvum]